ncbi:helix-turn-helix domain-containing protein [Streptomyces sp. NPDC060028]|uniref:helix-turn-helix domain-containing protein n=1 Tax=Streptomyces sp. NPDC060028 TaxID=3347041 RepID=UPI003690F15C
MSAQVGINVVNLSVLKNDRAKALRFSTLSRICEVLGCQPGDLITHDPSSGPGRAWSGRLGDTAAVCEAIRLGGSPAPRI